MLEHNEDVPHCSQAEVAAHLTFSKNDVDLVAFNKRGQPMLLVEVTGQHGTSDVWAARYRRNLLEHETMPNAPFFLIATPERLYFWRQDDPSPQEEPPHFTMDPAAGLKPYFETFKEDPKTTSGEALEWILFSWLSDLSWSARLGAEEDPSLRWLSESGLLEALKGAHIESGEVQ